MTGKLPIRSRDHQVTCVGKDNKALALSHSVLIPYSCPYSKAWQRSNIAVSSSQLNFRTVKTTDQQELGISPVLLFERLNTWVLLGDFCIFLPMWPFLCKTTGFLHKIHSGRKTPGSLWVTQLSFLRCNPFLNNSFLKYSPSVYKFDEEIKYYRWLLYMLCPFYTQHECCAFPEIVSSPVQILWRTCFNNNLSKETNFII